MSVLQIVSFFSTIAIVTLLASNGSASQPPQEGDEDRAQAAEAFETGQALFKNGEYVEAAAAFERAYLLAPHPSALANIGFCYDEVGDYPRAVVAFRKYMLQPNPETPKDTVKISRYLKSMKSKVGDLVVKCAPSVCEVIVDKVPYGVAPDSIVLLAGPHLVTITAVGGAVSTQYNIDVPKGGRIALNVDLSGEPSVMAVPEPVAVEPDPLRLGAPFWLSTSVTVLGLGATVVLGVLSTQNRQDFEAGGSIDPALKQRGEKLNLWVGIAAGVTAAAAVAAIVSAFVDVKKNRRPKGTGNVSVHPSRGTNIVWDGSLFVVSF
jgi:tetratricopeptide (TPR) repeat protein